MYHYQYMINKLNNYKKILIKQMIQKIDNKNKIKKHLISYKMNQKIIEKDKNNLIIV